MRLGRDLETASLPWHDVVVAGRAFVEEAADAIHVFGSGAPSLIRFARRTTEALVIVGPEAAKDLVGGVEIRSASEAEFAGEAILKGAPEAFDAALGLGSLGSDVGDAEWIQGADELGELTVVGELFHHRPVVVVANEDAVTIPVETERDAESAQPAAEQAEIAARVFGRKEFGDGNFASGIVEEAEQGEWWAALFEPAVEAAVNKQPLALALARAREAVLAMRGSAAFAGRADPGRAQQTAEGLAAKGKASDLTELLREVVVVETGIGGAGQIEDAVLHALWQAVVWLGRPRLACAQGLLTALPIARFEAWDMPGR